MEEILVPEEDLMPKYRKSAFLIGMFVLICYLLRLVAGIAIGALYHFYSESLSPDLIYIFHLTLSGLFIQVLPCVIGVFMFRYVKNEERSLRKLYAVPKNLKKALGNTIAVNGLGQIFNILTIVVVFLINTLAGGEVAESTAITETVPSSMTAGIAFMFLAVVIAPIFEEFMVRGLVMHELKPYGNGLAIFFSAFLFGLLHGNINQLFYTTAMGIALGYITYATGSIFASTIIHAIINGISSIAVLLMNTPSVQEYVMSGSTEAIPDGDMFVVTLFGIYMVSLLILVIVGLILAIMKIKQIKRYKVPKVWGEVSNGKKIRILLLSVPMIISINLIADVFFGFSDELIAKLFV